MGSKSGLSSLLSVTMKYMLFEEAMVAASFPSTWDIQINPIVFLDVLNGVYRINSAWRMFCIVECICPNIDLKT